MRNLNHSDSVRLGLERDLNYSDDVGLCSPGPPGNVRQPQARSGCLPSANTLLIIPNYPRGIIKNNDRCNLIIPNDFFNYSSNYHDSFNCSFYLHLIILWGSDNSNNKFDYSKLFPLIPSTSLPVLCGCWCTWYVLNCPDCVQEQKSRTMSNHSRLFP